MKTKNPVARALFIAGVAVAILGFLVGLMQASSTGDLTKLFSGLLAAGIGAVVLFGFGEIVSLLQQIRDRM